MSRIMTPAQVLKHSASSMSEADFTQQVLSLAKTFGWRTAHFRPAMNARGQWRTAVAGDGAGFPDLVLIRGQVGIAAELKVHTKPTPSQVVWLDAFRAAGFAAYVWRPENWEEIVKTLERIK